MCSELVSVIESGQLPEMNQSTRKAFSQYVYNAYSRVPEVHRKSSLHEDPETVLREVLNNELAASAQRDELEAKISDPAFRELSQNKIKAPSTI